MSAIAAGAERGPLRSVLTFFALTFVLAVPFWALGTTTALQLMPGLPIAALMFVCPGLAALILVGRDDGSAGAKALLAKVVDYRCIKAKKWYTLILFLNPGIFVLSYVVLRFGGTAIPVPQFQILPTLTLCMVFFISAVGEELGWSGYAIDPMQNRWGALSASLLLGAVWAVIHFVPLVQVHRSLAWIAWWSLWTVSARVIIVWLYNNTGKSVFAATLYHAVSNVCWQAFPVHGSFFDPRVTALITTFVAVTVTVAWRQRASSRLVS